MGSTPVDNVFSVPLGAHQSNTMYVLLIEQLPVYQLPVYAWRDMERAVLQSNFANNLFRGGCLFCIVHFIYPLLTMATSPGSANL